MTQEEPSALRRIVQGLLATVVRLLDVVVPGSPRRWVICSQGADVWHGNPQALYERLRGDDRVTCHVLVRGDEPGIAAGDAVPRWSLRSLAVLLRAGVVIVHHGKRDIDWPGIGGRGRLLVNVWHAIKTKRTGLQMPSSSLAERQRFLRKWHDVGLAFASSPLDAVAVAGAFGMPLANCVVSGLPRNDWLLCPDEDLPADVRAAGRDLHERLGGRRAILFAPTWRKERTEAALEAWRRTESALVDLLERHDAVLVTRLHRRDRLELSARSVALPQRTFPQTAALLRYADVLVTDASSIWLDFLLTGKPILLHALDEAAFREERGSLYDPAVQFPSARVADSDELLRRVERALTCPGDRGMSDADHAMALRMFHAHPEGGATERVVGTILERLWIGSRVA